MLIMERNVFFMVFFFLSLSFVMFSVQLFGQIKLQEIYNFCVELIRVCSIELNRSILFILHH